MKHQITKKQFTEAMKAVVQAKGTGFVYERQYGTGSCRYVHDSSTGSYPGCLIGAALHECGVPLDELRPKEGWSARGILGDLTTLPDDVIDAAYSAQEKQDAGKTWGEALATYIIRKDG